MTVYVLNTLLTPIDFDAFNTANFLFFRISIEEAKRILKKAEQENEQIISAIGHEATAKLLSQLLEREIPVNRVSIYLKPSDRGLHFFLKQRLPEGKVLSEEELKSLDYWLVLSVRIE